MDNPYAAMDRDELLAALQSFAKNWLAHDGCWFLAAEASHGLDEAIALDEAAWSRFAAAEARRIMKDHGIAPGGGLEVLESALSYRMYTLINRQHAEWSEDRSSLRFFMDVCRVQETRRRKGLDDFPCKSVGIQEFTTFARTVDSRIATRCLHCPPDAPDGLYCGWEFTLESDQA
jgi:hypothetical protein